jgi:DNA polymerase-3 subunit gamma/tau
MIVENAYPLERNGDRWVLCLDERHDTLLNDTQTRSIERALTRYVGRDQTVTIIVGEPPAETPAVRTARELKEQHEHAVAALRDDANVRALVEEFDAELKIDSVQPVKQQ